MGVSFSYLRAYFNYLRVLRYRHVEESVAYLPLTESTVVRNSYQLFGNRQNGGSQKGWERTFHYYAAICDYPRLPRKGLAGIFVRRISFSANHCYRLVELSLADILARACTDKSPIIAVARRRR